MHVAHWFARVDLASLPEGFKFQRSGSRKGEKPNFETFYCQCQAVVPVPVAAYARTCAARTGSARCCSELASSAMHGPAAAVSPSARGHSRLQYGTLSQLLAHSLAILPAAAIVCSSDFTKLNSLRAHAHAQLQAQQFEFRIRRRRGSSFKSLPAELTHPHGPRCG